METSYLGVHQTGSRPQTPQCYRSAPSPKPTQASAPASRRGVGLLVGQGPRRAQHASEALQCGCPKQSQGGSRPSPHFNHRPQGRQGGAETPLTVDQGSRDVMLARDAGNAGTRPKRFGENLKPLRLAPSPPSLRPRKHRDLTQRPLLSSLSRALLRPVVIATGKAAVTEGVP